MQREKHKTRPRSWSEWVHQGGKRWWMERGSRSRESRCLLWKHSKSTRTSETRGRWENKRYLFSQGFMARGKGNSSLAVYFYFISCPYKCRRLFWYEVFCLHSNISKASYLKVHCVKCGENSDIYHSGSIFFLLNNSNVYVCEQKCSLVGDGNTYAVRKTKQILF